MMQADGKGIAMRPKHRRAAAPIRAPRDKKMAEIVAVGLRPRRPRAEDIAAPPARRQAQPGPVATGQVGPRRR